MIQTQVFQFLQGLTENNNREWFHANKKSYEQAKSSVEAFIKELIKPFQYCVAEMIDDDDSLQVNEAITTALNALYQGILDTYK